MIVFIKLYFRDLFLGMHKKMLSQCKRIVLTEGDCLVMKARTIHFVRTAEDTVALAVNFIHRKDLRKFECLIKTLFLY